MKKVYAYPSADYPMAFLPIDGQPSILLTKDIFTVPVAEIKQKDWNSGLIIQGKQISHTLHPELMEHEWLKQVKFSFISRIMSPLTSYLVVENEAQRAALLRKQKQILASSNTLDVGDEVKKMSEPNLLIMILLLGVSLAIIRWRKFRKKYN